MSSILDALKKSEAERQRGVPPTLNTPILQRGQPAKSKRPAWLLPAVAAVALVAAWAGGLFSGGDSDDEAPAVTQAEPAVADAPAEAPAAAIASSVPAPPAAAEAATPDAAPDAMPETAAVETPEDQPRRRIGFGPFPPRPTSAPAAEASAATPDAAPDVAAPDAAVAAVDDPAPPAAPTPPAMPPVTPAAPATPATPAAQPPAAPVAAATPASTGNDVPTYYELPFAVRRDIPALSLTLHMYSDDPERRFAIINGVRVRDGQPIEGGVDVREIRPNGVVIRFKDTDFLLPARG